MNSNIESSYAAFDAVKDQLPEDVRIEYEKALKLIEINDIEMAAVRVGRIIEKILLTIIDSIPDDDLACSSKLKNGTCIDAMIQKISTSSFVMPKYIKTYISLIKDFRNAAAHDSYVDEHAIKLVVDAFRGIIPWFVEHVMTKVRPFTNFITDKGKIALYSDVVRVAMIDGVLHKDELIFIEDKRIELQIPEKQSKEIMIRVSNTIKYKFKELC